MALKMNDRRPAQTIGELDIHLGHLQARVAEVATLLHGMATKADIQDIRAEISQLATKAEVEKEIKALQRDIDRNKPATIARNAVAICAGISVIVAALSMLYQMAVAIDRIGAHMPATAPAASGSTR